MTEQLEKLRQEVAAMNSDQATGCLGSGGYLQFAYNAGYEIVKPLNLCSSAGDWEFLVSKDGWEWHIMTQVNNWPGSGFSRVIDEGRGWMGTIEDVYRMIEEGAYW